MSRGRAVAVLMSHNGEHRPAQDVERRPNDFDDFEQWTCSIARGDQESFGEFFARYAKRVFRHSLALAGGDEDLAKEVHQLTMIKAAAKFKTFRSEPELLAWLFRIARNSFLDHVRKRSFLQKLLSAFRAPDPETVLDGSNDDRTLESLDCALERLEADDRELLECVYFQKQKQEEIALATGTTRKAVERRLARIRRHLRTAIITDLRDEQTRR